MTDAPAVIDRLVEATNAHDLDGIVECFSAVYVNETPAHPRRGFQGREQVRRNWTAILAGAPDLSARVIGVAVRANRVWTEWEMSGTRRDGAVLAVAGVIIFAVDDDLIASARFYLEPVESTSGDADVAVDRAMTGPAS